MDQVSLRSGDLQGTLYCGARYYTISSVRNSASATFLATELSIDPNTGIISLYTSNGGTIGTHFATVTV